MPAPLLALGAAAGAGAYAHRKLTGDEKPDKPPRVQGVKITFWRAMAVVAVIGAIGAAVVYAKSRRPMIRH